VSIDVLIPEEELGHANLLSGPLDPCVLFCSEEDLRIGRESIKRRGSSNRMANHAKLLIDRFEDAVKLLPGGEKEVLVRLDAAAHPGIVMFNVEPQLNGRVHVSALDITGDRRTSPMRIVGPGGAPLPGGLGWVAQLPGLRALWLTQCRKGDANPKDLDVLKSLIVLEPWRDVSDSDLESLITLQRLQYLELEFCTQITGRFVRSLRRECQLRYVGLKDTAFERQYLPDLMRVRSLLRVMPRRVGMSSPALRTMAELRALSGKGEIESWFPD